MTPESTEIVLQENIRIFMFPFEVRLPETGTTDSEIIHVAKPDICVIWDQEKVDHKGCASPPNWIIEVLTPISAARDHVLKRDLYAANGVSEYWLVHPSDRIVMMYYDPWEGVFRQCCVIAAEGKMVAEILPGKEVDWDMVFGIPSPNWAESIATGRTSKRAQNY